MSAVTELTLRHHFRAGIDPSLPPLLLLHGTGGDENDLMPLGEAVAPGAALLGVRGAVEEGGMPRFFRRLAPGIFDEDDLRFRTEELAGFITAARTRYGIGAPVALGYSNGANIAAAMLMLRPGVLRGAALLRPMMPLRKPPAVVLAGEPVAILAGARDPMVPEAESRRLGQMLQDAGARVTFQSQPVGHGLVAQDVAELQRWFAGGV